MFTIERWEGGEFSQRVSETKGGISEGSLAHEMHERDEMNSASLAHSRDIGGPTLFSIARLRH